MREIGEYRFKASSYIIGVKPTLEPNTEMHILYYRVAPVPKRGMFYIKVNMDSSVSAVNT